MTNNENNSKLKLIRKPFIKNPVIVTGATRSGKSMLGPIISSLKGAEHVCVNHLMEQFPMLHNLGFISQATAVYLLRCAADFMLTDSFIGRNVNFRYSDMSGIWKYGDPGKYFKRLFAPEGEVVVEEIKKSNPTVVFNIHYGLWHVGIFLKAFPELRMLHLERHPIDLVHSWHIKGYAAEFAESPRNAALLVIGWEESYESLKGIDRIIHTIKKISDVHNQRRESLTTEEHQQVMIVSFEEMVTNSRVILSQIADFLKMEESLYTPIILERERCPRTLFPNERAKKLEDIKNLASQESFSLLEAMAKNYESKQK